MTGDVTGEAAGLPIGLAVWTGAGVATVFGLTGALLVAVPEQAPNTATLAAKTIANINDLLIIFSLLLFKFTDETPSAAQTSTAGLMCCVFPQTVRANYARRLPLHTNAARDRTHETRKLAKYFSSSSER